MDALKFIEERNRMCDYYWGGNAISGCAECPAFENTCSTSFRSVTAEYIEAVERWSQEHPRKTRQDVFLEQWPDAELTKDGAVSICPIAVSAAYRNKTGGCASPTRPRCAACRREFWMQEVE